MKYFYILSLLLMTFPALAGATITARLSHNPVSLDESFHLVYEADSSVDGEPDFSALTRDFEILSSSQSTNMRSINGQWSLKKSWDLALISKQAGIFTIPSIPFGSDTSPAVRITVKPASSDMPQGLSGKDAFFLEVTTDRKSAWVQSEIIYTVRFFSNVKLNRSSLSEPETSDPDAIIEQIGQVANYQKMINETPYSVSELRFAVYPQHSGKLTFKPIIFEGRLPSRGRSSSSLFDQFMQSGTLKRVRSKSISVDVKPRPANITAANWLPIEKLSIEEEWSEDITQLRTGEPVTRTLTIKATGITAEQLRDFDFPDIDGIKQYPDKPLIENQRKRDGITGVKQIKVAMIPAQAGRYFVPELRIPWWNTRTGTQEYTRVPETVIEVTGMAGMSELAPAIQLPATTAGPENQPAAETRPAAGGGIEPLISAGYWPWISLALAVGWIMTSILYFRSSRTQSSPPKQMHAPSLQPLERAVEKACARGDAAGTKDALLAWAKIRWPSASIASLADIADATPAELAGQISALNSTLYSAHDGGWDARALQSAFKAFTATGEKSAEHPDVILEPLYKT